MTNLRLLIADDHAVVRAGLRALLESRKGWQVCAEAADGRDAVEKAAKFNPDVVILDIGMPLLNGVEAARRIHKTLPKSEILILTMHESDELVQQVVEEGKSNKEVATLLNISVNTAEAHRANIMLKLDFRSFADLVMYAVRNKIIRT